MNTILVQCLLFNILAKAFKKEKENTEYTVKVWLNFKYCDRMRVKQDEKVHLQLRSKLDASKFLWGGENTSTLLFSQNNDRNSVFLQSETLYFLLLYSLKE